jgi:hypothetical protein
MGVGVCTTLICVARLVRMNKSLITAEPGTTRDRVYAYCDIGGRSVMVHRFHIALTHSSLVCERV